jgi:transposase
MPSHLVQLANNMVNTVRRRIVRAKYGRRGRKDDPEYGIKRLLLRNLEDLRDEQVAKLWHTMADDPALTDLHLVWIAKENLRDLLALRITRAHTTPAPSVVRDRWTTLLSWCADHDHIPELASFARTLDAWRQEIINSVLTGACNAGSEGVNRVQKLDLRAAFGYRNPDNQRRRARVATLRSARRGHHTGTHRHRLWTTGPTTVQVKGCATQPANTRARTWSTTTVAHLPHDRGHGGSSNGYGSISSANMPYGAPPEV